MNETIYTSINTYIKKFMSRKSKERLSITKVERDSLKGCQKIKSSKFPIYGQFLSYNNGSLETVK
jgi:hypothetical protein